MGRGSSSSSNPVKYYATLEQVICMSPVDAIVEIEINDEKAWVDPIVDNREFYIDKPELFGGKSSEGGVQGWCEARFGKPDQPKSSYLAEKISDVLSATRGVVSLVAKNFCLGQNPYAKPWHFRIKSTLKNADYTDNWYRSKATIVYSQYSSSSRYRFLKKFDNNKFLHATSWRTNDTLHGFFTDGYGFPVLNVNEQVETYYLDLNNDFNVNKTIQYKNLKVSIPQYGTPVFQQMRPLFPVTYDNYYDVRYYLNATGSRGYKDNRQKVSTNQFVEDLDWLTSQTFACENNNAWAVRLSGNTYDFKYQLGVTRRENYGHYGTTVTETVIGGNVNGLSYCDCVFTDGLVAYYAQTSTSNVTIYGYTNPGGTSKNTHGHQVSKSSGETFDAFGCDSENGITYVLTHDSVNETYHVNIYLATSGGLIETYTIPDTLPVSQIGDHTYFLLTNKYMVCVCGDIVLGFIRSFETDEADYDGSQLDYNPAHAIREAITSKVWGLGKDESVIDDANFRAVADTLYNEKIGISFVFESDDKVTDFITDVLKVVGGTLRIDRATGLVQIKLFRADYNPDELLTFDTSNVLSIADVKRTALSECVNQVTVKYKNYKTGEDASIVYQDLALMQAQGEMINADFEYPYVYFPQVADKLAQRDLYETSSQFFSCTLTVGLAGRFLNLGDCIKLNFPHLGIDNLVFRILKITYGGSSSNEIKLEIVQDKFYMPNSMGYVEPIDSKPDTPLPSTIEYAKTIELPYYILYKFGEDIDSLMDRTGNDGSKIGMFISSYNTVKLDGADQYFSADDGLTWTSIGHTDKSNFVASCVTMTSLDYLDTSFVYSRESEISKLNNGYVGLIDNEIIAVGEVDAQNNTISIARGLFDTVPQKHDIGAVVFFFQMSDKNLYNINDFVSGEYQFRFPYTVGNTRQELNACDVFTVETQARVYKPYPPACLKLGGNFFPDLKQYDLYYSTDMTWKGRNRLTQISDDFVVWTDTSNENEETGVQYEITMSNASGSVSYTYTTSYNSFGLRMPCDIERYAKITVKSFRTDNGVVTYCYQPVVLEGECREATLIFGINNYSQLTLTTNTYYPISVSVNENDEVILTISGDDFATELGLDEDGMVYRLIEL